MGGTATDRAGQLAGDIRQFGWYEMMRADEYGAANDNKTESDEV